MLSTCRFVTATSEPLALAETTHVRSSAAALLLLAGVFSSGAQELGGANPPTPAARSNPLFTNQPSIWEHGVGKGFRSSAQSLTLSAGATYGVAAFGGNEQHDLALGSLTYGHMLGPMVGHDHWFRGNPEIRLELFSGAQFSPDTRWFVGLTPHFRYSFATGTRWIPFVDLGAGVTATSIGPPDLSGTFEFNLQAGVGLEYFLKKNVALSVEARYMHWSCAGISQPNAGLNGVTGLLGIIIFF